MKQLVITLSESATEKYLEMAKQTSVESVEENCEPSDPLLKVLISSNTDYDSYVFFNGTDLGDVSVDFKELSTE